MQLSCFQEANGLYKIAGIGVGKLLCGWVENYFYLYFRVTVVCFHLDSPNLA